MKTVGLAALAVMGFGFAQTAHAELRVCNETADKQGVSVGYSENDNWVSEGWWNLSPGSCAVLVAGDLKQRYYYYRAEINGGDFDGGGFFFCTTTAEYTIVGDTNCAERGYDREDFQEIDTGTSATSWTLTITH